MRRDAGRDAIRILFYLLFFFLPSFFTDPTTECRPVPMGFRWDFTATGAIEELKKKRKKIADRRRDRRTERRRLPEGERERERERERKRKREREGEGEMDRHATVLIFICYSRVS